VYSFGILLWEVTHRSRPFAGMPSHEAAQAALRDERPPIQLVPELAGYGTIIERCWLREPAMRPLMASVAADIRELRDVAQVFERAKNFWLHRGFSAQCEGQFSERERERGEVESQAVPARVGLTRRPAVDNCCRRVCGSVEA